MSTDNLTETTEKKVGWPELFFDLVFVVAITRVATLVEHRHDALGLLEALVVFVPLYWTWVGATVLGNQQDIDRPSIRLRLFAVALAGVFMALALPEAYADAGMLLALAYWAGRVILLSTIARGILRGAGTPFNPYVASAVVTGPLLVVGALLDDHARLLVWGVAALFDLSTPTLFRGRMRGMHLDAAHFAERFGLFVLIALGESVVAVGTSTDLEHLGVTEVVTVALAFAVVTGLWWVYFQFAADAVRHALATAEVQLDVARLVLSYGHLAFIGAVVVVAVGLHEVVAHPAEHLGGTTAALLYGGAAAYLATFGFTRWAMFRLVSVTRLTAAAVVLVLAVPAALLPGVVALALLAVVLVVLNTYEYLTVAQIGWRARLRARG